MLKKRDKCRVSVACDAGKLAKPIALAHAAARKLVRVLACMCVCTCVCVCLCVCVRVCACVCV